ncbi:hypothetical protein CHS0354_011238 [Potamilus streckersoni]|uniref:Uncharacterized protein n=1 Tax=Potamilus streckersoni TaxID=2493646 RepID=A0AAE0RNF7_9BIVA|nr:hypothetical protein CHS0354_011238 [Potamilus streckersoni]
MSVSKYITSSPPARCRPPKNQTLSYKKLIQNGSGLNAFLYPAIFDNQTDVLEDALKTQCLSHSRRDSCPDKVLVGDEVPVYARSTCPWIYKVDHNPRRFPATLLVAKALCQYCIGSNGDMECHPITHTIPVFHQGDCVQGFYRYYRLTQDITTGFTCTGKRTRQVPTDNHDLYA